MDSSQFQMFITMVAAVVGVFIYWKRGGNKASAEANVALLQLVDANKLQILDLEKRVVRCEGLHTTNLGEIGELKGSLKEKDKRIEILENVRVDPETLKVLSYIGAVAKTAEPFMIRAEKHDDRVLVALEQIGMFMQNLNNHFVFNPNKN